MALDGVRALVFDTFGTVVDWYSGLAREAGPFLVRHGKPDVDPGDFAYAWRRLEQPAMEEVRSGEAKLLTLKDTPLWRSLGVIYRADRTLPRAAQAFVELTNRFAKKDGAPGK